MNIKNQIDISIVNTIFRNQKIPATKWHDVFN